MRHHKAFFLFLLVTALAVSVAGADILYPGGYDIQSDYTINETTFAIADTMVIHRYVVNHESFSLGGLYLSENLPSELEVVGQTATLNGAAVPYVFFEAVSDLEIPGYNAYHWLFDDPADKIALTLDPGDSLHLVLKVVSHDLGNYELPSHAAAFFGSGSGFFATSGPIDIMVTMVVDVDDDTDDPLPSEGGLRSAAFPNPFNAEINIRFSGLGSRGDRLNLKIYDILGHPVHEILGYYMNDAGIIHWHPGPETGSGIYLYRLSTGTDISSGKIMLLK